MEKDLFEQALQAIREMFNDKQSSASDTRINMKSLKEEIDMLLDGLPEDETEEV
jgi:hypothetical protein